MRFLLYIVIGASVVIAGILGFLRWQAGEATSFVSSNADGIFFIHWTDQQGHLVGQFQEVTVQGYPPQPKSENISFTGVRGGSNVSLTFSAFFVSLTWTGTVKDNTLTLEAPDSSGIMHAITFRAGTVADYNKAAAAYIDAVNTRAEAIRRKMAQEAELARQQREREAAIARHQQELARQQAAVVAANGSLGAALQGMGPALRQLGRDTDATQILNRFTKDWEIMERHFEKFQSDAAKQPLTCYQLHGVVGYDVNGTLTYDLNGRLGYDNNGAYSYWRNQLQGDETRLNDATQRVQGAAADLDSAVAANSLGTPGPNYTKDEIDARIAAATQQLALSSSTLSKVTAQKDDIMRKAQTLLKRAQDTMGELTCSQ